MVDLDELIDVAPLGVACQSSLSASSLPSGAQALVEDHSQDFGCCTNLEDRPWWELDLGEVLPLRRIIIANHRDLGSRGRARRLQIEASQDRRVWTTLHAGLSYFGDGVVDPAMQLELDDRIAARHIRLSLPERQILHLRRVMVFVSMGSKIRATNWKAGGAHPSIDSPWVGDNVSHQLIPIGNCESQRPPASRLRRGNRMGNVVAQITHALHLPERIGAARALARWADAARETTLDLDELIDVAPRGVACQSSLSASSPRNGAQTLVEDHSYEFGSSTILQARPWWEIDLGELLPLRRIVIANHCDRAYRARASRLVVEASQDAKSWTTLHSGLVYFGDGVTDPAMQIELDDRIVARHLRLSLPDRQILHLRRVMIFVSRGSKMLATHWKTHGLRPSLHSSGLGPPQRIIRIGRRDNDRLTGLKVRRGGRMGNGIVQITNALWLAKRIGIAHVWGPPLNVDVTDETISDGATTLFPPVQEPPAGLYLEAHFFRTAAIGAPITPADRYELAQRFIVPYFAMPAASRDGDPESAGELVVHIRSGDIFSTDVHPLMVQPPLSYYTTIVNDLLGRGMIDRVVIVAEDRLNPCIDALASYLSTRGVPACLQSGSLLEDLACLRKARHLVFGSGTFGPGVGLLSGPIDTLHAFDESGFAGLPNIRELTVLAPRAGSYIAKGDWRCTPEQLRLMLEFPPEDLEWRRLATTEVQ